MEAQEERAESLGIRAPSGVPKPLRVGNQRAGIEGELGDLTARDRRDTLWYESEEWLGPGKEGGK